MENKKDSNVYEKEQVVVLKNKKQLSVSGTNKVINLKNDCILLDTNYGLLQIFGNKLELIKLDNSTTQAEICGEIDTLKFATPKNKEPFFRKIFK